MASRLIFNNFQPPYNEKIIESSNGIISFAWQTFVKALFERLNPLGIEKSFVLANNKTTIVGDPDQDDIKGLAFNKQSVGCAFIDFYIQRTTDTNESVSSGSSIVYYKPKSDTWAFVSAPTVAGITLSITSAGQIQYTSTNVTGTTVISKITWRARTLDAKHSSYSQFLGAS